jgi:hypothetical protein
MAHVNDCKKMRGRASRLLELATRSRCEGRPDFAALLTDLAMEILEHAQDLEQRHESLTPGEKAKEASGRDVAQWEVRNRNVFASAPAQQLSRCAPDPSHQNPHRSTPKGDQ